MNNHYKFELSKIKLRKQIKKCKSASKSYYIDSILSNLTNIFAVKLYGSEDDNEKLNKQLAEDLRLSKLSQENSEKGYLPFFDKSLKPISEEFGCPYCGEYCYPVNYTVGGSFCESDCEFSGKTLIYCPKKECGFDISCQSVMVPLGIVLNKDSRYGCNKGDIFTITYKGKIYTFSVKSDYFTSGMLAHFIHEFINYNLTRKEITEYVYLEFII